MGLGGVSGKRLRPGTVSFTSQCRLWALRMGLQKKEMTVCTGCRWPSRKMKMVMVMSAGLARDVKGDPSTSYQGGRLEASTEGEESQKPRIADAASKNKADKRPIKEN